MHPGQLHGNISTDKVVAGIQACSVAFFFALCKKTETPKIQISRRKNRKEIKKTPNAVDQGEAGSKSRQTKLSINKDTREDDQLPCPQRK
jgi:hypothetical protein